MGDVHAATSGSVSAIPPSSTVPVRDDDDDDDDDDNDDDNNNDDNEDDDHVPHCITSTRCLQARAHDNAAHHCIRHAMCKL